MGVIEIVAVRVRLGRALVPLVVVLLASPVAAAVVRLTSGGLIETQAWREVGDELEVTLEGGTLRVPKADVLRIEGPPSRPVAPPGPPPSARPSPPPVAKVTPSAANVSPSPRPTPAAVSPPVSITLMPSPAPVALTAVQPIPASVAKVAPSAPNAPVVSRPVPAAMSPLAPTPPPAPVALPAPAPAVPSTPMTVARTAPSPPGAVPPRVPAAAASIPSRPSTVLADGRTVDQWQRDLASPAVEVRRRAASALAQLAESDADAVIHALTTALKDADAQVRIAAALALGPHGREPRAVTAVLVSTLGATDVARRRTGSQVLVMMGPAAKDAAPALLLAFASDPDRTVRQNAATALRQIGPAAEEVVPGLTSALRHKDPEVRRAAATLLDDLGSAEAPIRTGVAIPRP